MPLCGVYQMPCGCSVCLPRGSWDLFVASRTHTRIVFSLASTSVMSTVNGR